MGRVRTMGLAIVATLCAGVALAQSAWASNGAVAWGGGPNGTLGDGYYKPSYTPIAVRGLNGVAQISAQYPAAFALLENGTVEAWGDNSSGRLGIGTSGGTLSEPVPVEGLKEVVAVSAGSNHTLALLANGTVMAWGANGQGQLGTGNTTLSAVPVAVSGLTEVVAVSAGSEDSFALLANGTVMAWGANFSGQLGTGNTTGSKTPVPIEGLSGVIAISAGSDLHTLALLENGTVMAWGDNNHGDLGNGQATGEQHSPVAVPGLSGVTAVAADGNHSVVLLEDGTVEDWGSGAEGRLGNGSTADSSVPIQVPGLSHVTRIDADLQTMALLEDGSVMVWGGALGNGTNSTSSVPVAAHTSGAVGIAAGFGVGYAWGAPAPVVSSLEPATGPQAGGTSVTINGSGFTDASTVRFGSTSVPFTVESPTTIAVQAPASGIAGVAGMHVTVTNGKGGSDPTAADVFSYQVGGGAPEFGRCLKTGPKGTGKYLGGCTVESGEGSYEWFPGPGPKPKFTLAKKENTAIFVTDGVTSKSKITCLGATGTGEVTGPKTIGGLTVTLTGCEGSGCPANTQGQPTGTILLGPLAGVLGVEKAGETTKKNRVGLDLIGLESVFSEFICGGGLVKVVLTGGVISAPLPANGMTLARAVKYTETAGHQKPEAFEGQEKSVLTATINGSPEQSGFLASWVLTSEEKIEINTVL